jgi:signal transduction histidine kinase
VNDQTCPIDENSEQLLEAKRLAEALVENRHRSCLQRLKRRDVARDGYQQGRLGTGGPHLPGYLGAGEHRHLQVEDHRHRGPCQSLRQGVAAVVGDDHLALQRRLQQQRQLVGAVVIVIGDQQQRSGRRWRGGRGHQRPSQNSRNRVIALLRWPPHDRTFAPAREACFLLPAELPTVPPIAWGNLRTTFPPQRGMRLSDFITTSIESILAEWEAFAHTHITVAQPMNRAELRDHAAEILAAIAADLRRSQTPEQQTAKSKGLAPAAESVSQTAAQVHAVLRARNGFDVNQMASEYRALRASVLRLWFAAVHAVESDGVEDLMRFNEAIDQALAESLLQFAGEVERSRALFLGVLGHDLRNPLNTILLSAALLEVRPQHDPVGIARRITDNCRRAGRLVDDLLDYTRTSLGGDMQVAAVAMDLLPAVRAELDALQVMHPARSLRLTATGSTLGRWDELRLRQMVGNLVGNALQHGTPGSPVEVVIDGTKADELVLSVANEGEPIPTALAERIFEPLTQGAASPNGADSAHRHLGLGLYIARQIVRAHEGRIALSSPPGGRIVFTVTLPRGATWL